MSEKNKIKDKFLFIQYIRDFFNEKRFLDVLTPPMVSNPGFDPHVHPFQIFSTKPPIEKKSLYLHTSPEFCMKSMLSQGLSEIFSISYCFRDEPSSPIHSNQFIMLEWYRTHCRYEQIMDDLQELIIYLVNQMQKNNLINSSPFDSLILERLTVQELFLKYLKIDILKYLKIDDIKTLIKKKFSELKISNIENMSWDDCFFLIFLNYIEPKLVNHPLLIIDEYPAPLSALSTIKKSNPNVCERFELYINGIEIGNCFNELTDLDEQTIRFEYSNKMKQENYQYKLPKPKLLYKALKTGIPASSGIAVGIERLYKALNIKIENIFFNC